MNPFIPEHLAFSIICDSDGNVFDCAGVCGGDLVYDGCNFCGSPALEGGVDANFECVCIDGECNLDCLIEDSCGMCGVEVSDSNCISNQHKELIAISQYTSLFIDSNGEVKIWGRDNYSQLSGLPEMDNVIDIAGGYNHLLAVE